MHLVLHDYQKAVLEKVLENHSTGVFLGMGLGKTAITLAAIVKEMYEKFDVKRVLIIAPRTVAEATWQDEAEHWDEFRCLTFSTVLGTRRQREKALATPADVYVTSRDNVTWLCERYNYNLPFDMLVIDESTSFKNPQAKRFKALKKCRGCFSKIVLLTGTPRPNSLMDLWAQVYLLDGGQRLGRTITSYRNKYFVPDRRNGFIVYSYKVRGPEAEQEIYDKISDICISLKASDYVNMPDVLPPVNYPIVLDDKAKRLYNQLALEQVLTLKDTEITAQNAAAVSNKLLQLANGALYDDGGKTVEVHEAKLDALADLAESGENLLVFYSYRHDLDRIMERFPEAVQLEGAEDVRAWNAGKIKMLLAHPASAGYGLNLQAGGHVIVWFGLTWSLEQYQQANARLARQGQKEPVSIIRLVAKGTMDERVIGALNGKRRGQDAMIEAVKLSVEEALT